MANNRTNSSTQGLESSAHLPKRADSVQLSLRRIGLDKDKQEKQQKLNLKNFDDFSTNRMDNLKSRKVSNPQLSNLRFQMLAQAKRARSVSNTLDSKMSFENSMIDRADTDPKLCKSRLQLNNERMVKNSLTQLIDSKNEEDFKHSLVFKVLERKIKNYLLKSGKCHDKSKLDEIAKKMAAFVSDVMMETYRNKKNSKKSSKGGQIKDKNSGDAKSNCKSGVSLSSSNSSLKSNISRGSRPSMKSSLKTIHEESPKPKKIMRSTSTDPQRERNNSARVQGKLPKNRTTSNESVQSPPVKKQLKLASRNKNLNNETVKTKKVAKGTKKSNFLPDTSMESISIKNEKAKINSWLDEVSERTRKWTEWIGQTITKAEQSKRKKNGNPVQNVDCDSANILKSKKSSDSFGNSPSDVWKNEKEALRKIKGESVQEWLLRNNVDLINLADSSGLSFHTNSDESSLFTVWSSREPSSLFAGETELAKLCQLGIINSDVKK